MGRREVSDMNRKIKDDQRALEKLSSTVKASREKAEAKAGALAVMEERRQQFEGHDKDEDAKLNRGEVLAYSKAQFDGFDIPSAVLDKIMQVLEPVTVDKFH